MQYIVGRGKKIERESMLSSQQGVVTFMQMYIIRWKFVFFLCWKAARACMLIE